MKNIFLLILIWPAVVLGQTEDSMSCSFDLMVIDQSLNSAREMYFQENPQPLIDGETGDEGDSNHNLLQNVTALLKLLPSKAKVIDQMNSEIEIVKKSNPDFIVAQDKIYEVVDRYLPVFEKLYQQDVEFLDALEKLRLKLHVTKQDIEVLKKKYPPASMCGGVRINDYLASVRKVIEKYQTTAENVSSRVSGYLGQQRLIFEITWKSSLREIRYKYLDKGVSEVESLKRQMLSSLELLHGFENFVEWWYATGDFQSEDHLKYFTYYKALRTYRVRLMELERYRSLLDAKDAPTSAKARILEELDLRKTAIRQYITDLEVGGVAAQRENQNNAVKRYQSLVHKPADCKAQLNAFQALLADERSFRVSTDAFIKIVDACEGGER